MKRLHLLLPSRLAPRLMLLALVALLPFAALLAMDQWRGASLSRERLLAGLRTTAAAAAADMDRTLLRGEALLTLLVEREAVRRIDRTACSTQLQGLPSLTPLLANLGLVDASGRVVCLARGNPEALVDLHQRPYVQRALASGRVEIGKPVQSALLDRPVLGLARRVEGLDGQVAVLILSVDLAAQHREFEALGLPAGAALWIEDGEGQVVVGQALPAAKEQLSFTLPLHQQGWRVRFEVPREQVYGSVDGELRWALSLLAVVLLAVLLMVWRLARRVAEPLEALAGLSLRVAEGAFDGRAREDLPGEVGQLGLAFNRMLAARAAVEAAMRESERNYRDMLEQSSLLAVALEGGGRISFCNGGFAALVGEPAAQLRGRDWIADFLPPERENERAALLASGRAGAISGRSLRELCLPDGSRRMVAWSSAPRLGPDGRVVGLLLVGQDVTDAERASRQLARSRDMFSALWRSGRQLVRGGDDVATLCRESCAAVVENGHALIATAWLPVQPGTATLRPWGHAGPLDQVLGGADCELDPSLPELAVTPAVRAMRSGEAAVSNDYMETVRGVPWFEQARRVGIRSVAALPLRCKGRVVGVFTVHMSEPGWFDAELLGLLEALASELGFGIDQIERRKAHAAAVAHANASLERFRLAASTGNVWAWEASGNSFSFQRSALPRLCAPGQGDGSRVADWLELVVDADRARLREAVVGHLKQRGRLDLEVRARSVDGAPLWLHVRGQAVWGLDGRAVQMAGTLFDVSARREAEAAEAMHRARSEFLGRMSHELRTPLNAILGFIQLLQTDGEARLDERQHAWLANAEQGGWRLLTLIDELIGAAGVESWPPDERG